MEYPPHPCVRATTESGTTWTIDQEHLVYSREPGPDANQWSPMDGLPLAYATLTQLAVGKPIIMWITPSSPAGLPATSTLVTKIETVDTCLLVETKGRRFSVE